MKLIFFNLKAVGSSTDFVYTLKKRASLPSGQKLKTKTLKVASDLFKVGNKTTVWKAELYFTLSGTIFTEIDLHNVIHQ